MTDPNNPPLAILATKMLATLGCVAADDLDRAAAVVLLRHNTNPAYADEWWHGADGLPAPWGPPRHHLAEGYPEPDVDGYVARVHRGITRDELPGVIGFLAAVLAAQDDSEAQS